MAVQLTIAFFLMMLSIVMGVAYWVWSRETAAATAGGPAAGAGGAAEDAAEEELSGLFRFLSALGAMLPSELQERKAIRTELIAAGMRDPWSLQVLLGARGVAAVVFGLLGAAYMTFIGADFWNTSIVFAGAGYFGYTAPERYLRKRIKQRKQKIQQGLPDFLDLLVISVDSGLSLDNALADTARDLALVHPVITDELSVFQLEVRAGTSRAEALRNLGLRTREPEMRKLTSLLIQADRFGTSITKILRTQARYMRTRRRHRAEEMAHKVGVKLIFPIFFLIMPSIFIIAAGPAVLQLVLNFRGLASGI